MHVHVFACPVHVLTCMSYRSTIPPQSWRTAKAMTLIFFLLTLIALGIINFSLAVIVSVVLTPPTILAQPFLPNRFDQHLELCNVNGVTALWGV